MASESRDASDRDYEEWLGRLYAKAPQSISRQGRFEVPRPSTFIIGNKTVIQNFRAICEAVDRDPQHLLRFISRHLATAGGLEGEQANFQGRFDAQLISRIIENYVKEFVVCPVCRSPDTKIQREERFRFLVCGACGAQSAVRAI